MSHFSAVHRRTSISSGLANVYDNRFGTDTTTAAATGWFTFALHSANRRVWLDGSKADDTGDGLSAATAKKTIDAALTVFSNGSWTSGDQLMIAPSTYSSSTSSWNGGAGGLCNRPGISAVYPTAILCYDPADAANSAKYGKLTGSARPVVLISSGNIFGNTAAGDSHYATQGIIFDFQNADGATGPHWQQKHDNVVYQNCAFRQSEVTMDCTGSVYDATGATYGASGNISKCSFYGQWASGANTAGLYLAGTKDWVFEDNVWVHCGWMIGASRDDGNAGGAAGTNHGHYIGAFNNNVTGRRHTYIDNSYDGANFRAGGNLSSLATLDEPLAANMGAFSGGIGDAPNGITLALDDWLIMGSSPLTSGNPGGSGISNTNTLSGSYMRNIAAFDNPTPGIFLDSYNGGNAQNIVSITHSGTTATLTVDHVHGLSTGQHIYVDGASPSDYNVANVAITVINSTSFSYVMGTTPATNATVLGHYTPQVPQYLLVDKVHTYNYSSSWDSIDWDPAQIHNTYTNIISDQLATGAGNSTSTVGTFPGYKTRDQVITAVLTGIGLTPGASYYARKAQLVNAALHRPDLPWAQWLIGVGLPAMSLTPTYATPAYSTYTDTPVTVYPTSVGSLTISTLNFTHGVNSSATLSGLCANPVLTCSDLPAGLSITGRVISGSATSAGTPTIHVVETSQDGSVTHTTAFTLNIT